MELRHRSDQLTPEQIARRRDAAILRALKTPHREQKAEPEAAERARCGAAGAPGARGGSEGGRNWR